MLDANIKGKECMNNKREWKMERRNCEFYARNRILKAVMC